MLVGKNPREWAARARLMSIALVAIGVFVPVARNTRGHTFTIVGAPSWVIFSVLVAVAISVVFESDLPLTVGRKVGWLGVAALAGVALYACNQFNHALTFFVYQTAGELAAEPGVNKDVYWKTLYTLADTDGRIPMFGDLRSMYESYGDQFTYNGTHLFWDVINSLSLSDAKRLSSLPGGFYLVMPFGLALVLTGALANAWLLVRGLPKRWLGKTAVAAAIVAPTQVATSEGLQGE